MIIARFTIRQRRRRLAARDDAGAALQRRAERGARAGPPTSGVRSTLTSPATPSRAEQARRRARLPDQALVDLRAGLDLLVGVDPDAGHDDALRAERHVVADRDALVDAHVRADVAGAADDRALDERAAADVRRARRRPSASCARPRGGSRSRPARSTAPTVAPGRDAAVVADERGALDRVEVVDVDALADPDVAAQADARDVRAARARRARRSSPAGTGRGCRCPASSRRRRGRRSAGPSRAAAGRAPSRSRTAGRSGCGAAPRARARRCRC